ncbi:bifunctional adenosylcobinamide kinase/adenosylcobinamide-phosphate guanylyltransferase [Catenovulum sediminis]|uniref:Bifunctional adenosylcobalamin biosynthesis protein n=1 Tax=Catenovulum sediminis TaxID=1740262 RepID=A0ABV1RIZ4_9ALTE|nr:bifunctional adenosylcobinamide kinase/adenosylcobinamide-phosphate guanylyltransferase [Catenovulum sediminis]
MIHLVLGGARSGKSGFAEKIAKQYAKNGKQVVYIATAEQTDDEMMQRIQHHQQQRPNDWAIVEEAVEIVSVLQSYNDTHFVILLDCLTLWLNNLLYYKPDQVLPDYYNQLTETLISLKSDVILVANEVGLGIIPDNALSRQFVDEVGRLNQRLAQIAHHSVFMVAGLPMNLKGALND